MGNELELIQFRYFRVADLFYATTEIINSWEEWKYKEGCRLV